MDNLKRGTKICYINNSVNKSLPQVFVFAQNETPNFDCLEEGVAWSVIKNIGRGSRSTFYYNDQFSVQAYWDNFSNKTAQITAKIGSKYQVMQDTTGIVLKPDGEASDEKTIEIENTIEVIDGISAQFCNSGKILLAKNQVGYGQSAIFKPTNKIYFGLASDITRGSSLKSAVLSSTKFFELDLTGFTYVEISLNGNAQKGYQFQIERGS
ncbi:hypothetical protein [Saccharicrinis aurantiacus]|uniref:hypothetical protein n=1 Tax=Saccharicrinis aurantiacus TaxID=1849719 RepID=UPI000838296F|nr:hypothetical protein [Saccharicrinis aurantiacus]